MGRVRVAIDEKGGPPLMAHLTQWLVDQGFRTESNRSVTQLTLSAADVSAVIVSSAGAVSALITALASFARARKSKIVLTAPDGTVLEVSGPVSKRAIDEFASRLDLANDREEK